MFIENYQNGGSKILNGVVSIDETTENRIPLIKKNQFDLPTTIQTSPKKRDTIHYEEIIMTIIIWSSKFFKMKSIQMCHFEFQVNFSFTKFCNKPVVSPKGEWCNLKLPMPCSQGLTNEIWALVCRPQGITTSHSLILI